MSWLTSFGEKYAPPLTLIRSGLDDLSYKNDVAPKFGIMDDAGYGLFVFVHPEQPSNRDRDFREGPRYYVVLVTEDGERELCATDSVTEALACYHAAFKKHVVIK